MEDPAEDKQPKEIERVIHSNMAEARKEQKRLEKEARKRAKEE